MPLIKPTILLALCVSSIYCIVKTDFPTNDMRKTRNLLKTDILEEKGEIYGKV